MVERNSATAPAEPATNRPADDSAPRGQAGTGRDEGEHRGEQDRQPARKPSRSCGRSSSSPPLAGEGLGEGVAAPDSKRLSSAADAAGTLSQQSGEQRPAL